MVDAAMVAEAKRLASAHGYQEMKCDECKGRGQKVSSDGNAPGARTSRECGYCEGLGLVWYSQSEGSQLAKARGALHSAHEVVKRIQGTS